MSVTAATTAGAVRDARTFSTRRMTLAGEKKCMPMTWHGAGHGDTVHGMVHAVMDGMVHATVHGMVSCTVVRGACG